jgi:glycosyltransferase involved in cell wall biosynthesis
VQVHLADGGGSRLVLELARRLPEHGVELASSYLVPPHDMAVPYREAGIDTTFLDHRAGRAPATVIDLVRRIRDTAADLVHTHEMLPKLVGHPAARVARTPVVTHIHGFYPTSTGRGYRARRRRLQLRIAYGRQVRRAIAVSHAVAAQYAPMVRCPLVVLHNGVDVERFRATAGDHDGAALLESLGLRDRRVVLFVGRLVPLKRTETLVPMMQRVVRQVPESVLVVCGDGPDRAGLAIAAGRSLAGRVTFTGWVDDVVPLLQAADVLVFPSRVEGLGLAPLEAMAAGTPVVASRLPVVAEYVDDGVTGLMVDPTDADAFAAAVCRVLEHPDEARAMADKAQAQVAVDFDLDTQAGRLADLYRQVLTGRRRSPG